MCNPNIKKKSTNNMIFGIFNPYSNIDCFVNRNLTQTYWPLFVNGVYYINCAPGYQIARRLGERNRVQTFS